jgi:AraC-like DNA-binding protein
MDKPMVMHAHREGHLIFKLGGPDATCTVDGRAQAISPASAVAVSPWQPHSFSPEAASEGSCCLILYVDPMRLLEAGRRSLGMLRFASPSIEVTAPIGRLIESVAGRMLESQRGDRGLAEEIYALTELCYEQSRQAGRMAAGLRTPDRESDFRIRNSIRLMCSRLGDELVLDGIARDAGLSRPHFFKLFRKCVGLTPNLYLNILKTERSVELLTTTREPVTSIGFDLGFASQASFTRFFIANVGIPPTDYRRAMVLAA